MFINKIHEEIYKYDVQFPEGITKPALLSETDATAENCRPSHNGTSEPGS